MPDSMTAFDNWTTFTFGDLVRQVKDRVDPEESGLDRYVAGEHMDTDELRIRRWGYIGDDYLGPAFHMRFKPGHVLYGSRRTYLRKVALADFEGITANTTYVLESANSEFLLPDLLPFIMQTESFHENSKRESKGSVNPYVNFSDLAWYEFALPPLAEQLRIAEVLKKSRQATEAAYSAAEHLLLVRRSMQSNLLFPTSGHGKELQCRIDDIVEINPRDPPLDETAPFFPMASIDEWEREIGNHEPRGNRGGIRARSGDVLMARITPCLENGKVAQVPEHIERCGGSTEFIVFRAKTGISKSFVYWLLTSDRIRNVAIGMMCGSTGRQRVSGSDLEGLLLPKFEHREMTRLGALIDGIECQRKEMLKRAEVASMLQFRLINELLGGEQ